MPDAVVVAIAKAVTTELEGATLSQAIEPKRSYADWELELADSDILHVDVVAVTTQQKTELSSQTKIQYLIPVDIAVRKRFGTDKQDDDTGRIDIDEIDALMLLVQEIHELFTPRRLTDFEDGVWQDTRTLVAPQVKHLREMRQFSAIVRVTFRTDRSVV